MSEAALATLIIQLLPVAETGIEHAVAWVESLIAAAKQNNDWTPEQDAMWRAAMWARTKDPKYQPIP